MPLYTKDASFYQDRLGTNIGKTQKRMAFSYRNLTASSTGSSGDVVSASVECSRALGCRCAQCDSSAAAVEGVAEMNPGHQTLPEYIAWHRVCDVLARCVRTHETSVVWPRFWCENADFAKTGSGQLSEKRSGLNLLGSGSQAWWVRAPQEPPQPDRRDGDDGTGQA